MGINLFVVVMLFGGWFAGKLFTKLKLPAVLGMLLFGVAFSYFWRDATPALILDADPFLKSFALIVILLRAGLGISKSTLKKVGITALLMSFIPCIFEGATLVFLLHHLFGFSFKVAGLTAFMI